MLYIYICILLLISCQAEKSDCYNCVTEIYNIETNELVKRYENEKCNTLENILRHEKLWTGEYDRFHSELIGFSDTINMRMITKCFKIK